MKKKAKNIIVYIFMLLLLILPLLTVILPKKTFSESENKNLKDFPKLSVDNVLNRKFMTGFEEYFADHFVYRDSWIPMKTGFEYASGKKEVNTVFLTEERLIQNIGTPDYEKTEANAVAINKFVEKYNNIPFSIMLVPTASEIYRDTLLKSTPLLDQNKYIADFYEKIYNVETVDVYQSLFAQKDSYIYYRTDHHWTSFGAYLGYNALAKPLGFKPYTQDKFDIEMFSNNFLGTLYSKILLKSDFRDTIELYHANDEDVVKSVEYQFIDTTENYDSLYFRENLNTKDKYSVFLGKNQAIVNINTSVNNGQKLLLFKDSYSHTLMQFLSLHYEKITLVDLRYLSTDVTTLIDMDEYTQGLFLYNLGAFITDSSPKILELSTLDK